LNPRNVHYELPDAHFFCLPSLNARFMPGRRFGTLRALPLQQANSSGMQ